MNNNMKGYYITASSQNSLIPTNRAERFKIILKDPIKIPAYSKVKVIHFFTTYATNFTRPGICILCEELKSLDSINGTTGEKNIGLIYQTGGKISSRSIDPNNAAGNQNIVNTLQRTIYDTYETPKMKLNNANEMIISELNFRATRLTGEPIVSNEIQNTSLSFYIGNDI